MLCFTRILNICSIFLKYLSSSIYNINIFIIIINFKLENFIAIMYLKIDLLI